MDEQTMLRKMRSGDSAGLWDCLIFDEPIDVAQVDYVQYGDYRIPVEVN